MTENASTITIQVKGNTITEKNRVFFPALNEEPNSITIQALEEAETGGMVSFSSIEELMRDLND